VGEWIIVLSACNEFDHKINHPIAHIFDGRSVSTDELEDILEHLSDIVHTLYVKAGARNFLFVDVPPLDWSPGGEFLLYMK
jgi:hypothetical protein